MCHFLHPQQMAQEVVAASDFQHQSEIGKRGGDALGPNGESCLLKNCGNGHRIITFVKH